MKNILHAIYLRTDTTTQSLAKSALAQLILKIVYLSAKPISVDEIKEEINGLLSTKISDERINDSIRILVSEFKINEDNFKYSIRTSRKNKIDITFDEYENRVNRIIDNYFQPAETLKNHIRNWFENVTIIFFTEYKSEWIAEKTYNVRKEDRYIGLRNLLDRETRRDKNIVDADKQWLKDQYLKFFYSSDDDVQSIFWDYGMCVYASSLITATSGADKISIETFRNSKFIIDTNILMYLSLEEDKYYNSYKNLEIIFEKLNITPVLFHITVDEYKKTMGFKNEEILKVIDKYEEEVIDALNDPFIKTAKSRGCVTIEDFESFFNEILDVPDFFIEKVPIIKIDTADVVEEINKGMENEEILSRLNEIYRNRHYYLKIKDISKDKTKDKRKRPLMHDAGLISGAEFLRIKDKCQIITRDITVKQYGIIYSLRDEPCISIGLDNLISILAIDNGGIDIDPSNFKPLFANMIKLALLPERNAFQVEDLAKMLDVEEQISNLLPKDIADIAKEYNSNKLKEIDEEKINIQLVRRIQTYKIKYSKDIEVAKAEVTLSKNEKDRFQRKSEISTTALRRRIYDSEMLKYDKKRRNSIVIWFIALPLIATLATLIGIYCIKKNPTDSFIAYLLGLATNIIIWFFSTLLYSKPKIFKTYKDSVMNLNNVVDEILSKELKDEE